MNQMKVSEEKRSEQIFLCAQQSLIAGSGVCVLVGDEQIALFYLPAEEPCIYAVSNWDPIGRANVLSRGILGDIEGELVVASPLYKQHFSLVTGACIEEPEHALTLYSVVLSDGEVHLLPSKGAENAA